MLRSGTTPTSPTWSSATAPTQRTFSGRRFRRSWARVSSGNQLSGPVVLAEVGGGFLRVSARGARLRLLGGDALGRSATPRVLHDARAERRVRVAHRADAGRHPED